MSGFEVAGVVLGVLPLAIRAVKGYMDLLSSMKDAKRNLKALVHDLETEQIRLQSTCEVLLDGIVPPSAIDRLIQTPLGSEWKLYNDQLRLRLWVTSQKFEEQVFEMQGAVEELQTKLCMEDDGGTKLTDRFAILRELKRGTTFSLKKKDYEGILSRIRTANSILRDLTGQNCGLEPSRRHRSQARLISLIRDLARSIFNGLRSTSACCCARAHDVCLELESRHAILVPTDIDDQVARNFDFHVEFSSKTTWEEESSPTLALWESIYIKLADANTAKPAVARTTIPAVPVPAPPRASRGVGWTKSLSLKLSARETSSSSPTQTLVDVSRSLVVTPVAAVGVPLAHIPRDISELCRAIVRNPDAPAVGCYGYITDAERKFELRPPESLPSKTRTIITLRELLTQGESNTSLPPFEYPDKLRVALTVAVSILHLYQTPWLPRVVTLEDVLFLPENDRSRVSAPDGEPAYRPFVVRNLKERNNHPSQPPNDPRPVNHTVLSLGALLIQLMIGKVVDSVDVVSGHMDMNSILAKYEAGTRLNGEVVTMGGINYATAVKWCLDAVLRVEGLEDDGFCQNFYGAVVAKLEDDVKLLSAGN